MASFDVVRESNRMTLRATAGCVHVEFPAPHIALIRYEGVGYEAFVAPIVAEIEQRGRFPIVLAVDAWALSSYETGFRKLWTKWMDDNKPRGVFILANSRLVTMGISLTNAVLGGVIRAFSSRAEFERAIDGERHTDSSASANG